MNSKDDGYKYLWLFFLITYAFSWIFWIPNALIVHGVTLPPKLVNFLASPLNPAAFGPFFAAFLLTFLQSGGKGVLQLLKRGLDFNFKKTWLIVILLGPVFIFGGAILTSILLRIRVLDLSVISNPPYAMVAFLVILFTGGPFQEEFGWRGYALPRLQSHFNALTSSLILGFFWWLWHLPAIFIPGRFMTNNILVFLALLVVIVLTSVLFTWVYNETEGSVLAVILLHTAMNWSMWLVMPSMQMDLATSGLMIAFLAIALWAKHAVSAGCKSSAI